MTEIDLYEYVKIIETKQDFDFFLTLLLQDFQKNKSGWENDALESFLNGLYGYSSDKKIELQPTWRQFAEFLLAAKVYE